MDLSIKRLAPLKFSRYEEPNKLENKSILQGTYIRDRQTLAMLDE